MKQKNITIREEQDRWIRKNHINLSSLVREAIENERKRD
jgi:post-segregation antitoxin (ccd killing protein)